MYQALTTNARPTNVSPRRTVDTTGFGWPSAPVAGMKVPIARFPPSPITLVATRSISPAGFIRWNIVLVALVTVRTPSTTGTGVSAPLTWPSHFSPTRSFGSETGETALVNWFRASHDTGDPAS